MIKNTETDVRVLATDKCWIEGEAVAQLHSVAKLPNVKTAVGMPDIHVGRGIPVGFAVVTEGLIYPHLIGNDIGCGMDFYRTDLELRRVKLDKWVQKLKGLESPWNGDRTAWLEQEFAIPTEHDASLGTIGGGNHFAELQCIEETVDKVACEKLGINVRKLFLLVHSGSRGLGESIKKKFAEFKLHGLEIGSESATDYLRVHDNATRWAKANRSLIANRFLDCLRARGERLFDVDHNFIELDQTIGADSWIHRKGASPSNKGPIVIPGSRGTFSYLVQPICSDVENANSLPHGAGRKWSRSECKDRLRNRYTVESLTRTALGSRVVCDNKNLLYQEAPEAYKDIEVIIGSLLEMKLITVVAKLRPMITYKLNNDRTKNKTHR